MKKVIFGLSHIVIPVTELAIAKGFYLDLLGFDLQQETENLLLLSSGFVGIRLVQSTSPILPVHFWLEVDCLPGALALLKQPQVHSVRQAQYEIATVQDPFENVITLWRPLTENDFETPPPLNTTMPWDTQAETTLQTLLQSVPVEFRAKARKIAVVEAEFLGRSKHLITTDLAVQGCILSAPFFMRDNLKGPLAELSIDWRHFQALFQEEG